MEIVNSKTRARHSVLIEPIESADYTKITKKRYFFEWKEEKNQGVYKLSIVESGDIVGLISFEKIPDEWRIHIRLLTVSEENKGRSKQYENIAGNLITHVAKIAIMDYGELACVSLKPKGLITQHYIDKYGMNITGTTLSIEITEILTLINTYDNG